MRGKYIPRVPRSCNTCGETFMFLPTREKYGEGKYCSRECYWNRPLDSDAERFWPKVIKTDGCWLWTGYRNPAGYGQFRFKGHARLAHRVAYELTVGPIPEGMELCHHCDNPQCVRPAHMFIGTHADNFADATRKGRMKGPKNPARGERHPQSKLTEDDVRFIRKALTDRTHTRRELEAMYGVSYDTIWKIDKRVAWKHVE